MLILAFFSVCCKANAVEVLFEPEEINTTINHIEKVEIFLKTDDNESVNAFEMSVEYPSEFLKLRDWSNGNSIINLWIEEPENNNETFSFQGIVPGGGYFGKKGLLMTLYFEGIKEGAAKIKIKSDSRILLNDGLGTQVESSFSSAIIKIKLSEGDLPKEKPFEFTEKISPEQFTPIISRADEIYDGKYFLVFFTQDKDSGIDHYEISEGERSFEISESPYLLKN